MISHKHKCIFIHIPKCAGTSIEAALGHLDGHTGRGGQDHRTIRGIERPFITPAAFNSKENTLEVLHRIKRQNYNTVLNFRNKYTVTKNQYDSYFKFTFIRNPWARAFSWYRSLMRDEVHQKIYGLTTQNSFNESLQLFAGKKLLKSQIFYIKNYKGSIPMDYIGRFENLNEDFQEICKKMNINDVSLPHRLKGSGENYREHYDEFSKKIIMDTYKEEIEMFGYTF